MALPIVYHPDYVAPLKPGHRFPMSKYGYLREALVARELLPGVGGYIAPAPAGFRELTRVHEAGYVDRVLTQTLTPEEVRGIGLPGSAAVARRATLSVAGTTLAARLALENGLACNAAGGSHHADPKGGAGFCVFNDIAVAARTLLDEGQVSRVLVLDLDVHQGDGTARIFAQDAAVQTVSVHAQKNYPTQKARSDRDISLADGVEDAAYLEAVETVLGEALTAMPFDLVFYNAGVDPHADDRLGRLALTEEGLRARDRLVLARCRAVGLPVAAALGGGYDPDIRKTAARHAILFEEAARQAA